MGLRKYIPNEYRKRIKDIDYKTLFNEGKKIIFFDLDNTLADYETHHATDELKKTIENIKTTGFKITILSNNHKRRVTTFMRELGVDGLYDLGKPFTGKVVKYMKYNKYSADEIILIGDQVMTDLKFASKLGFYSILVDPIKPETEHWYTRINRFFERMKLRSIEKKLNEVYVDLKLGERII